MKINADFSALIRAIETMGAAPRAIAINASSNLISKKFEPDPIDEELKQGFTGTIKDVHIDFDTGLLSVKGRQVLLYIQDHRGCGIDSVMKDPSTGNKYHVAYCRTLQEQMKNGRYERYVVTNDRSGIFFISERNWASKEIKEAQARLNVCKNCLKQLNYKNYLSNYKVFNVFSLQDFFATYQTYFEYMPSRKSGNAKGDTYTDDWDQISKSYRAKKGWRCEACGINLNQHKNLLHTHHISGVPSNNSNNNLKALCKVCHAEQPNHQHMYAGITGQEKQIILNLQKNNSMVMY